MSKINDWVEIMPSIKFIEDAQREAINYKQHLQGDIKTRWVGKVGEEALRHYFDMWQRPYTDLTQNGASFVDFDVNFRKVDIKTVATSYYPRENYACNVNPEQHYQNKLVDTYIFARYVIPTRVVVLLGWIDKLEFEKNALLRTPNSKVTDKFTTNTELMELEISYLNSMTTL